MNIGEKQLDTCSFTHVPSGQFCRAAFTGCSLFQNFAGLCSRDENSTGTKGRYLPVSAFFYLRSEGASLELARAPGQTAHCAVLLVVLPVPDHPATSAVFAKISYSVS